MALEKKPRSRKKQYLDLLQYSYVGLEMGFAVGIGIVIGLLLDNKFDTKPWLTMFFMACGIAAAAKAFWRAAKEMREKAYGKDADKGEEDGP